MLDAMDLNGLSVNLRSLFMDSSKVLEIISILNRTGQLDSLLNMLGIVGKDSDSFPNKRGKIVIVGESEISKQQLEGIAKGFAIGQNIDLPLGCHVSFKLFLLLFCKGADQSVSGFHSFIQSLGVLTALFEAALAGMNVS